MGGGKKGGAKVEVTLYYMSQHQGVCAGPVDALRRIIIKEKEAWAGRVSHQQAIYISKEDLFGGAKKEGGVAGTIMYLPGLDTQLMPDNLAVKLGRADGSDCPAYRGLTSLFFYGAEGGVTYTNNLGELLWNSLTGGSSGGTGFYWSANVPYLPSIWVTVERAPKGLDQAYARILRIGSNEYPFETPTLGIDASGQFRFSPDGQLMAHFNTSGNMTWWDVEALQPISTSPGFMFTGSVSDLDFDSQGNTYYIGVNGSSQRVLNVVGPGGSPIGTVTDAPAILFETIRVFETTGEPVVYVTYQTHSGYLLNDTHQTDTLLARDTWIDENAHIWQLLQPTTSSNSLTLRDLTAEIEFVLTGPVTRSSPSHARGCKTPYGHHFIHTDGYFLLVDPATGTILDSDVAPWTDPPKLPAKDPRKTSFWDIWSQYSLEDGSLIRTINPNLWSLTSDSRHAYDETNNAIWTRRSSDGAAMVRLLDRGDFDANPAHVIFECLTDTTWGMGSPDTLIDVVSFTEAGVTLFDEQLGLSMIWTRQAAIQDFVQEVLDHIQAVLFVDPSTGLLTLKLIRGDYVAATLPVLDQSNADLANFGRKLWGEIINEIVVTWTNPENEQDETVTVHDLASITTQGGIVSDGRNYYGVRTAALAQRLALRDLRASGAPLATCEAEVDRTQWQLRPASVVKLTWPEYGLSEVVMRVTAIDYGKPGDMGIKLTLIEDVFGLDIGTYTVPPSSIWEDTSSDPDPLDETQLLTMPYYAEVQGGTAGDLAYPDVHAGILGGTDNADVWGFEVWAEVALADGGTEWQQLTTNSVTARALTSADLDAEATSANVVFVSATGQTAPQVGNLVLIGSGDDEDTELALVTLISLAGYTLNRGVLDTIPRAWPAGTPAWFINVDEASIADPTTRSAGEVVSYKLRTQTSQGLLSLAAPNTDPFTLSERPWLPLRPANVQVDGVLFNDVTTPIDMTARTDPWVTVSWANRNRLTEDTAILAWTDSTVTLETGQTTTIEVLTPDLLTVLATHSGLTGTSFDVPDASFSAAGPIVYIRAKAERTDDDGTFESLQAHGLWVEVNDTTDGALSAAGTGAASLTGASALGGALSASGVGAASFTGQAAASTIDGTLGSTDAGILAAVLFTVSGTTVTVVGQKNVASVTRLTGAVYRITFSSALSHTNYGILAGARQPGAANHRPVLVQPNRDSGSGNTYSTSAVDVLTQLASSSGIDPTHCAVVVYDPQTISASNYLAAASWTVSGSTITLQRQTNVAGMSRHAAGTYRVNFNSALADSDYAEWTMSRYVDFANVASPISGQNRNTTIPSNLHSTASLDLCTGLFNSTSTSRVDTARGSVLVGNADVAPRGTIARVRFSATGGTISIIDQYNVSAVARSAAGRYELTFALPCIDANYGVIASGKWAGSTDDDTPVIGANNNVGGENQYTTTKLNITAMSYSGAQGDPDFVNVWVLKPWLM